MYKKFYTHFIEANPDVQHYAAHSHHYWPDVTLDATIQYWKDSAKLVDSKWDYFFSTKIPSTQALIADVLNLTKPEQIVFAPNTHELVYRVLSCFTHLPQVRVLTTDSEFHSFERQINRLSEGGRFVADKVSTLEAEFVITGVEAAAISVFSAGVFTDTVVAGATTGLATSG